MLSMLLKLIKSSFFGDRRRALLLEKFAEGIFVQDSAGRTWKAILEGMQEDSVCRVRLTSDLAAVQAEVRDSLDNEAQRTWPNNQPQEITLFFSCDLQEIDECIEALKHAAKELIANL